MTNLIQNENLYLSNVQQKQDKNKSILGKDDFLRILITQLQNQDPLNPLDDREFISQMAQFSSLEQMTNMSTSIQKFVELQTSQQLIQHSELIGKKVKWEQLAQSTTGQATSQTFENDVKSVKMDKDGKLKIQLDNDVWIDNHQIVQISKPS